MKTFHNCVGFPFAFSAFTANFSFFLFHLSFCTGNFARNSPYNKGLHPGNTRKIWHTSLNDYNPNFT